MMFPCSQWVVPQVLNMFLQAFSPLAPHFIPFPLPKVSPLLHETLDVSKPEVFLYANIVNDSFYTVL
jgi:hypothetical protein